MHPTSPTHTGTPPHAGSAEAMGTGPAAGAGFDILDDSRHAQPEGDEEVTGPQRPVTAVPAHPDPAVPDSAVLDSAVLDSAGADDEDGVVERPMPARRRNRRVLWAVLALLLVIVLVLAGFALKAFGVFESDKDYDSTVGQGAALVEVESDSSIRDIGTTLADAGVVGSRKAFVNAVGDRTVDMGFYRLPKEISAAAAVAKMQGAQNRVGRMVIPEGRQLDSKKGADDQVIPGVFDEIAQATHVETDDETYGVTAKELSETAASATADDLGVPGWARAAFDELHGDHRRIEGLIASGAWETLNPRDDAKTLLRHLVTESSKRYTAWGLESAGETQMTPYQTLTIASIVEAEVRDDADYPKVARVIFNRLGADQRLEMDSTANYTAAIANIDLSTEAYADKNAWNTYHHKGLSVTPIGAVGEKAIDATLHPAPGNWMYFVTVDKAGKTLFSKTFEKHKQNRKLACRNKLLATGCE